MALSGWEEKTIGDIAEFAGGSQPPKTTFKHKPSPDHIRLIQIRDYKDDRFETYIPKSLAKNHCTEEDTMIGRYGPPVFQILRGLRGSYNVALIKATPVTGINAKFFFYLLSQDTLFKYIEKLSQRSSGQTGVDMPALKAYPAIIPPIPEQNAT